MTDQPTLRDILLKERSALLDLSTRNRLLSIPLRTKNARLIEIVDEKAAEIQDLLDGGKALAFLPGRQGTDEERDPPDDKETSGIPQPNEASGEKRAADLSLQTRLTSEGLQKRLFDIWYDARTLEEEQGVNILFLAIGLLRWYEADDSDVARYAPLLLMPVALERSSASDKFKLKTRGEPLATNITLQAKLKAEFNILLEDADTESDEFDVAGYLAKVSETVAKQKRWEVQPDGMVLGFFSFAKFLMYRDLDPQLWPENASIDSHPLVSALLRDGFPQSDPLIPDDTAPIDPVIPPAALNHVVDADSSQAVAIEEAARGRTLVVKGPPGTGKSQTITNIIAAAVAQGKKVLFVAEKMAALDVVYRRLKQAGLGALALELHSKKVSKRQVLDDLKRTEALVLEPTPSDPSIIELLGESRDRLNSHAARLHEPIAPHGYTAYQILGNCIRTRAFARDDIALQDAPLWSVRDRKTREDLVRDIQGRLTQIGMPAAHPWYGVACEPLDPRDAERIPRRITILREALAAARQAAGVIRSALAPEQSDATLAELAALLLIADSAVSVPAEADRASFAHPAWEGRELTGLVAAGRRYVAARAALDNSFRELAWTADIVPIRRKLEEKGASLFRIFDGAYRARLAALKALAKNPLPPTLPERLALLDIVTEGQDARAAFEARQSTGTAFGRNWKSAESDWDRLSTIMTWDTAQSDLPAGFYARLATSDPVSLAAAHGKLSDELARFANDWSALAADLKLDMRMAFATEDIRQVPLGALDAKLAGWIAADAQLSRWILFAAKCREANALGLGPLVSAAASGAVTRDGLFDAWEGAYFDALRSALFRDRPDLRGFDGETLDRQVEGFRRLDLARMALAQQQIATRHADERPKGPVLPRSPFGILKGEFAKKSKHLPIRQLLDKAGPAIQQLKPVFMMSPLSVAQFLKPGGLQFDILLMDEASQIEPVDALGAIARAKQIVVVGDERQLPPTRFFAKLTGDESEDDDATYDAKDVESILELCLAKGAPHRMLNWHYRSRHQSLIAVSNNEFYENRLFIIPSPFDATAGMGLKFHYLPNAIYDRGNSRTNPDEARAVAEAVIAHARGTPELSLGVGAFSVAQRGAILKELELLRRANPELETFFVQNPLEPFFVKNLENIQGDERDVIFISVGYGRSETGVLAMNFGPLSADGGERRLNVLISRAKLRCEVFSSITAEDIDLERGRSRGVASFKRFLSFAQTGQFQHDEPSGGDPDSVFEEQVAAKLRAQGHDVRAQIGTAGFFVDLAIADPDKPGRYVLGIECDGAQYHAARSARDRDRLRQSVLEDHDWIIHRIWSSDWYLRPADELRKVEDAIAAARDVWRNRDQIREKAG